MSKSFELAKGFLGKTVEVVMDRPMGSRHPKWGFEYPVNYGFVEGVLAPDGENLDAYFLGAGEPLERAAGKCVAIVHRLDDDDDKLVVVPDGIELSNNDIRRVTHFQEQYFKTEIIRE